MTGGGKTLTSSIGRLNISLYIWVNKYTERHRQFQIQCLEVGHEKFSLTLYIPSGITPQLGYDIKLEWPEGVYNTVDKLQSDRPQGRSTQFDVYRSGQWESVDFYPPQLRGTPGFNFVILCGRKGKMAGVGSGISGTASEPLARLAWMFKLYVDQIQPAYPAYATAAKLLTAPGSRIG